MADSEVDATVIKLTQETLGKYVKKPPLSDKLLRKPPFRFLLDVFSAVMKETGYFEGLYTPDELNIENIKNRDDKMQFLQKMIDVIKLTTHQNLTVRTSKIVAGQEPEKTNELLQLMGGIIEQQLDWQLAVTQVVAKSNGSNTPTMNVNESKPIKTNKDGKSVTKERKDQTKESKTTTTTTKSTKSSSNKNTPTPNSLKEEKPKIRTKEKQISPNGKVSNRRDSVKDKQRSNSRTGKEADIKEKTTKKTKAEASGNGKDATTSNQKIQKSTTKIERKLSQEESAQVTKKKEVSPVSQLNTRNKTPEADATKDISIPLMNNERRNSKQQQEEQEQQQPQQLIEERSTMAITKAPETPTKMEQTAETSIQTSIVKESNSRKSSAQRKNSATSSSKSRRSSAQAQLPDESGENGTASDSLQSIRETTTNIATALVNETATPLQLQQQQQQQQQQQPKLQKPQFQATTNVANITATDVKRESTFTRENSHESNNSFGQRPRTSLRPPSARPASARPGAPRRRDRNVEIVLQANDQIKMSGINVKLETFGDFDDDGENLVIIENANAHDMDNSGVTHAAQAQLEASHMAQQGHLVQQILETQKELVQQQSGDAAASTKDDILNSTRQGSGTARQMLTLRDVIQNLTKSINPFGKLMDFIPEDIDAMQLELTMWRDTYTQAMNELKRERCLTESATEPLKQQLIQIDLNIKEYVEMIDASRAKILQNNEKILKMLMEQ